MDFIFGSLGSQLPQYRDLGASRGLWPCETSHRLFLYGQGCIRSSVGVTFPVDPVVEGMVSSLAGTPKGAPMQGVDPFLRGQGATASLFAGLPIPQAAWERLEAFGHARPPTSLGGSAACSFVDKGVSTSESDLLWLTKATSFGAEISLLQMYVVEWLHRAEKGLLVNPSSASTSFMLGLAAKLARLSLNQNLRVLVKATRHRRALVLPLCGLPPACGASLRRAANFGS